MIAMVFMAITFTSCENVPDPYGKPVSPIIPYEPAGTGVETDPFNVAGAIEKCKEIGGKASTEKYYIKGYAAGAAEVDGGKVTFTMTDSKEGKGKKFTAYKVAGSDNKNLPSDFAVSIGEEIVLYGPMYYYNSKTPETANGAYIVTVNGEKTGSNTPGGDTDKGTEDKPFDVASAISAGEMTGVYLKGYIVGTAYSNQETKQTEWNFGTTNAQASNLLLAATATETDYTKCMPVALPSGSAIRTSLNIKDNPGNLGKEVLLYGNLTKYFSQPGMKETSYAVLDGTAIGTKPGGGSDPQPSNFEAGQYFFIINIDGTYKEGIPVASDKAYGYITLEDATVTDGKLAGKDANIFTFTKEGDGFTIQDASNRYYYMDDSHTSFQLAAEKPASNHIWSVNVGSDGKATITNIGRNKVLDYSTQYKNLSPGSNGGGYPMLLKQGAVIDGGGDTGGDSYALVTTIAAGKYIIAAPKEGATYAVAVPLASNKTYGYLSPADATLTDNKISTEAANEFTFTATTGGYTIQDPSGRYLYMSGTYNSFNVSADVPASGHVWAVTFEGNNVKIVNVEMSKTLQYSSQYKSYGAYADITNTLPSLFKK